MVLGEKARTGDKLHNAIMRRRIGRGPRFAMELLKQFVGASPLFRQLWRNALDPLNEVERDSCRELSRSEQHFAP